MDLLRYLGKEEWVEINGFVLTNRVASHKTTRRIILVKISNSILKALSLRCLWVIQVMSETCIRDSREKWGVESLILLQTFEDILRWKLGALQCDCKIMNGIFQKDWIITSWSDIILTISLILKKHCILCFPVSDNSLKTTYMRLLHEKLSLIPRGQILFFHYELFKVK